MSPPVAKPKRYGQVIRLVPGKYAEYAALHRAVWPEVLKTIRACHIQNYTIYYHHAIRCLFACFEYTGTDFEADMAKMASDPKTQEWWSYTRPCQEPIQDSESGWANMEEIFHID